MLRPGANRDPDSEIWIPRPDTPGRLLARRGYDPHDGAWGRVIQHTYETTAELRMAFARDCDPDDPRSEIWWPVPGEEPPQQPRSPRGPMSLPPPRALPDPGVLQVGPNPPRSPSAASMGQKFPADPGKSAIFPL